MTATQSRPALRCEVCGCRESDSFMRAGDTCRYVDDRLRECGGRLREGK